MQQRSGSCPLERALGLLRGAIVDDEEEADDDSRCKGDRRETKWTCLGPLWRTGGLSQEPHSATSGATPARLDSFSTGDDAWSNSSVPALQGRHSVHLQPRLGYETIRLGAGGNTRGALPRPPSQSSRPAHRRSRARARRRRRCSSSRHAVREHAARPLARGGRPHLERAHQFRPRPSLGVREGLAERGIEPLNTLMAQRGCAYSVTMASG